MNLREQILQARKEFHDALDAFNNNTRVRRCSHPRDERSSRKVGQPYPGVQSVGRRNSGRSGTVRETVLAKPCRNLSGNRETKRILVMT